MRLRSFSTKPIIHIPKSSSIHPFGDPSNQRPILHDVEWKINEGEAWAVLSASSGENGKRALLQTLLGHLRVLTDSTSISQDGIFPFLGRNVDPYSRIASVSFSHRSGKSSGGAFYDYTARYGAIRDEDALTLRETAFDEVVQLSSEDKLLFDNLVKEMDLERLLDLPLIALSNGQTRRARIVRAVLRKPELLLLDEPLTGLDVLSRPKLLQLLHKLHQTQKPRVILGLRTRDDIPEWITHLALVQDGTVKAGKKAAIVPFITHQSPSTTSSHSISSTAGPLVLDLQNVNVKYADRIVLNNIHWQVRQGERWHLEGANGSGKTTLMSLILGDHPQSYVQPYLLLPSPQPSLSPLSASASKPSTQYILNHRKRIPTPHLRQTIGVVSPELFDAFPRRHPGMTVREAIGTGFEGVFVPFPGNGIGATEPDQESLHAWREERVCEMLENLGPSAWTPSLNPRQVAQEFTEKRFTDLGIGEQRMVLLMRALVGRPPVVFLDEVWSGMSEEMVRAARKYLKEKVGNDQVVVVITHWEDEVPWTENEGVKSFSPIHLNITKYSSDHSPIHPHITEVLQDLNAELQKERAAWKTAEQEKMLSWNNFVPRESKQASFIFHNFDIPLATFPVNTWENGSETCICTSVHPFLSSLIYNHDRATNKKYWYQDSASASSKRKHPKVFYSKKHRRLFANKQAICAEYDDLDKTNERFPVTPAKKLAVFKSPRDDCIRHIHSIFFKDDALVLTSLAWDNSRSS
ncbi:hypothetical protein AN958_11667 [Leucoagaricus sp. SymC.cos]|nr:hypothetical protein AN958_11667 [Leucoagaricus sp. SymC.cos]